MKNIAFKLIACALLLTVFCFTACKKDALKVNEEKHYVQTNAQTPSDPLLGTATDLTLKPNGRANILPGGDIVWTGDYDISGRKLTVTVAELNTKFLFTIISEEELHGEHGEVLKLQK